MSEPKSATGTIATRLATAMDARGVSQRKLERDAGLPSSYVSRALRQEWEPGTDALRRLAAALDVRYAWLAIGEGEGGFVAFSKSHPIGKAMIDAMLASHEISEEAAHVLREQARINPCDFARKTWEEIALQTEARLRTAREEARLDGLVARPQTTIPESPPVAVRTAPESEALSAVETLPKLPPRKHGGGSAKVPTKASAGLALDQSQYHAWVAADDERGGRRPSGINLRVREPGGDPMEGTVMMPLARVGEFDEGEAIPTERDSIPSLDAPLPPDVEPTYKSEPSQLAPRAAKREPRS